MRYTISTTIECTAEEAAEIAADHSYGTVIQFTAQPVEPRSELVRIKHLPADDAGHPHRIRVMWQGRPYTEQFDHAARDAVEHAILAGTECTRVEYEGYLRYRAIWD